jgi:6-phosphogluconolactonase
LTTRDRLAIRVYVGSFTRSGVQRGRGTGVSILRFEEGGPTLAHEGIAPLDADPSWIQVLPHRGTVYAAAHTSRFEGQLGGAVVAFAINGDSGGLRRLNQQPVPFPHPNHICVVGDRFLLTSSGLGAGVTVLPIANDGVLEEPCFFVHGDGRAIIPFGRTTTSIPMPFPRDAAFPHCVIADRDGRFVLVADLIRDRVDVYRFDAATGRLAKVRSAATHPGAGPRALAFHPTSDLLYAVNEMDSSLSAMRFDSLTGDLRELGHASTRASNAGTANKAGSIAAHQQGRFLFVSNRGDDSVATFTIDEEGALERTSEVPSCPRGCQGAVSQEAHPRHIALTPDGRWLFVSNTYADCLSVFAVSQVTGELTPAVCATVPTPTCVAFLAV